MKNIRSTLKINRIIKEILNKPIRYAIVLCAAFICVTVILRAGELMLRAWVNDTFLFLIIAVIISGLIYRITIQKETKKRMIRIMILLGTLCGLGLAAPYLWLAGELFHIPYKDDVITVDGYKFVAVETHFLDHWYELYEYKNIFVSGSDCDHMLGDIIKTDSGETLFYDTDGNQVYHPDEM